MKIDLDPRGLDTMMQLWRDTTDMKVPVHDNFKIHFMQNRGEILRNFERTASAWSLMFSNMTPAEGYAEEFIQIKAKVKEFGDWAKNELKKLDIVAINEEIEIGIMETLSEPLTREAFEQMIRMLKGVGGSGPAKS